MRLNIYFILPILNLNLQSMFILKLTLLFLNSFLHWSLVKIWFEKSQVLYKTNIYIYVQFCVVLFHDKNWYTTKNHLSYRSSEWIPNPYKWTTLLKDNFISIDQKYLSKFEKENKVRKIRSVFKKKWTSVRQYASVYELFISQWFTKLSKIQISLFGVYLF